MSEIDILHDILLRLGQVQGSLDAIKSRQDEMTEWMGDMDTRLRAVEARADRSWHVLAAVGAVALAVVPQILDRILK
jgi:hypothetical protein